MLRNTTKMFAVAAVVATAAAACGGSSSGGSSAQPSTGSSSAAGGGGKTITVGLLTDVTGLAASGNKLSEAGVKGGVVYAQRNGYKIKYVVADTQTNPSAVLSAAQKLVQQNHVDAVIAHSALAFAAAQYLTKQNIPVVGVAEDGPEWISAKNMFSVWGAIHTEKVSTTFGELMKVLGVTTVGALGYSISPSSAEAAKAAGVSAQAVGLKVGYIDSKFPFGSTDVQPVALQMKNTKVDGVSTATDPNTAFALIKALKNLNASPKAVVLASGYGVDTLQAGPGALQAAQNVYFTLQWQPVEVGSDATKQFQADLKAAGLDQAEVDHPSEAIYGGYLSVVLLVRALKAANGSTDHQALITALSNIHDWDSAGLFPPGKTLDINDRQNVITGAGNCLYATKLVGDKFELVKGADPVCGKDTGKTVTAG